MFVAPVVRAGVLGSPSRCDLCYRTSSAVAMAPSNDSSAPKSGADIEVGEVCEACADYPIRLIKAVHCDHMALLDAHAQALDLHHRP